jgi:DNA-binding CsgD family transcriptional regulator
VGNPISELTDRQRQLLERVASGIKTSKSLAVETGLSPGTIDNALQAAARVLGVNDRVSAAARYMDLIQQNSHTPSHMRTEGFAEWLKSALFRLTSSGWRGVTMAWSFLTLLLRGVSLGGDRHDLRWDQITLEVLRVALIGAVALTVLALFVLGFFQTFS